MANLKFGAYFKLCAIILFLNSNPIFSQKNVPVSLDKNTFGSIKARQIGPAVMSGRISALDAVQSDPRIIYIGSAGGGLWKSLNGGVQFVPVFDDYCQSIGAVTIDQLHPDTVWIGTGETWVRNSTSIGDGIYKSTNGGDNWKKMGLEDSERIARIVIHPDNPNTVYAAVMGHLWNPNIERGLYVTVDGGENWKKLLYVDENTGCCDIAINPENPSILYAAMWDYRRYPDFFRSGGPGSGLYISKNDGTTWDKVQQGLPEEELGRIALSVSKPDPNIVYALIESRKTALFRSDDKGDSWNMIDDSPVLGKRPFYFSNIYADPVDSSRVYKPGYVLNVSNDKGESFRVSYLKGGNVHVDHHALWVSEKDNNLLYLGTDGGLYISNDKGSSWRFVRDLPVSQFYHVSVDKNKPYNVYGGLQDNGSWMAPSISPGGIQSKDWLFVGGGDGFNVIPDPYDSNLLYWQYQGGNIRKRFMNTGEVKDIKPFASFEDDKLRFNWNTSIVFSPARDVMYVGSQYLYKSYDKGEKWIKISPDLTTDDSLKQLQFKSGGITIDNTTAENHCTIYTINESPLDSNIIWVGTDDGNLQVTRDGGQTWTSVSRNVPLIQFGAWCSYVCPSRYEPQTAYVTFDGHRQGDKKPYVFKTVDFGLTWIPITDINLNGYCYKIIEDTENQNLLFLGTELGLFVTIDGGAIWSQFKGNLPDVSVRDIVLQDYENDLVIATHGRGIMIIDDITPLRHLTREIILKDVVIFPS
ncbi:MAG: hypothetical protein K8R53_13510, partial [Bacteroidales bacterium]|nr:hypothetical protein [Bacteroidales bacterium]